MPAKSLPQRKDSSREWGRWGTGDARGMIEGDTISAAADLRDAKEGRPLLFYTGWGASPAGPHPTSSTLQCTPGPLPTHFSHSPDELRPDELRPAVFFFFFPTGRTSSDFWVAETLQEIKQGSSLKGALFKCCWFAGLEKKISPVESGRRALRARLPDSQSGEVQGKVCETKKTGYNPLLTELGLAPYVPLTV